MAPSPSPGQRVVRALVGRPLDPRDRSILHRLSLVAVVAWVGLGSDALSSVAYGPEEAFLALGHHPYLGLFVALASAVTIFVITGSYSQLVQAFPAGGGGYVVASKLLSPTLGALSGCALLIDYVLTVAISIASGADALFSLLDPSWRVAKLPVSVAALLVLVVLNLRGAKETVLPLVPIFFAFLATHVGAILYALVAHAGDLPRLASSTSADVSSASAEFGTAGALFLLLRAYGVGAGTYTGIEAVSNAMPILREPRVETAKRTMTYMAASLALVVVGLMLSYLLLDVHATRGHTLNAVLFEAVTAAWSPGPARAFVVVALASEALLLLAASQTGFLGGPKVLANMAVDRYMPARYTALGDRLVSERGVLLMGGAALLVLLATRGEVRLLVVLYAISVFVTFTLSQLGMVRYWVQGRKKLRPWGAFPAWKWKALMNGVGFLLTLFILTMVVAAKFREGAWVTVLLILGLLAFSLAIRRHYANVAGRLARIDLGALEQALPASPSPVLAIDPRAPTAIVLVGGYNAMGLQALRAVASRGGFRQFVVLEVGVIDSGNFKGAAEVDRLEESVQEDVARYLELLRSRGYGAEGIVEVGTDVVEAVGRVVPRLRSTYPEATFVAGRLDLGRRRWTRGLHSHTGEAVGRALAREHIPFLLLDIQFPAGR